MPAVILPLYLPIFTYPLPLTHTHTGLMLAFISPVPSISACIMFPFSCQRVASVPYFTAWSMYRTTHFSGKKFIWGTELFQIPPVGINLSIILCEKQNLVCFCTVLRRVFSSQFNNIILNLHLSLLLLSFLYSSSSSTVKCDHLCVTRIQKKTSGVIDRFKILAYTYVVLEVIRNSYPQIKNL